MSKKQEFANYCTHGAGFILSVVGFFVLICQKTTNTWGQLFALLVYGLSLTTLYGISTLYHLIEDEKAKNLFRLLDHMAIYFFIAGTYTPLVITLPILWSSFLLISVWLMAFYGVYSKITSESRFTLIASVPYLAMGWLAILAINPIMNTLPGFNVALIFLGGLIYSFGFFFYVKDHIPYYHAIWHCFVLAGSFLHFWTIALT